MHVREVFRLASLLLLSACTFSVNAQVVGGQYAMEFLRLPNSPHVSAMGGINVANPDDDVSFALQNPSLMRPGLHNELELNYNSYYAGIGIANLAYGYYLPKLNTAFFLGVQDVNYGTFTQTDNLGNQYGDFHAGEYAVSIGASRSYGERWRYGADLKFASSTLYDYTAKAVLCDVGIDYMDTTNLLNIGATAKNMGVMIRNYTPGNTEPLPFDLQLGISKEFKHLPLRLFATVHHLYEWNIRYNNPADVTQTNIFGNNDTSTNTSSTKGYFADILFRHFIFGAELTLGHRLVLTVAYNHLQRAELALTDHPGPAGFNFGASVLLNKFQVHYARSYYYIGGAYNEFGITMALNKLMGMGKTSQSVWNNTYPNW